MAQVLFLCQVLPYPLDAGPKVRAYYMLRHLGQKHTVTMAAFVRPDDSQDAVAHLHEVCAAVHTVPMQRSLGRNLRAGLRGLGSGLPIVIVRDEIEAMQTQLRHLTQTNAFDVVHADQLSMAGYGLQAIRDTAGRRPAGVLDEHNALYLLVERIAANEPNPLRRAIARREAHALARYEAAMGRTYDAMLTVTDEDQQRLLALYPPAERQAVQPRLTTVPICVDPDHTPAVAHQAAAHPMILHLGTMFWPPNISGVLWFVHDVLPRIWQQMPEARFVIVGKNPPPEVTALTVDPRILVTGYVADPVPYLAAADVFIVPLHAGGGMRVKILDAWLWGLPVVSTAIGAEGITLREGENILIASDAEAFAAATLHLIRDTALNNRLRAAGRAWVTATYGWRSVYRVVDTVYARLLAQAEPDPREGK